MNSCFPFNNILEVEERLILLRKAAAALRVSHIAILREGVVWLVYSKAGGLFWVDLEQYRTGQSQARHLPGGIAQVEKIVSMCGATARLLSLQAYVDELTALVG